MVGLRFLGRRFLDTRSPASRLRARDFLGDPCRLQRELEGSFDPLHGNPSRHESRLGSALSSELYDCLPANVSAAV